MNLPKEYEYYNNVAYPWETYLNVDNSDEQPLMFGIDQLSGTLIFSILYSTHFIEFRCSYNGIQYSIKSPIGDNIYTYWYINDSRLNFQYQYELDTIDLELKKFGMNFLGRLEIVDKLEDSMTPVKVKIPDQISKGEFIDLVREMNQTRFSKFDSILENLNEENLVKVHAFLETLIFKFSKQYKYHDDSGKVFTSYTSFNDIDIIKLMFYTGNVSKFKLKFAD